MDTLERLQSISGALRSVQSEAAAASKSVAGTVSAAAAAAAQVEQHAGRIAEFQASAAEAAHTLSSHASEVETHVQRAGAAVGELERQAAAAVEAVEEVGNAADRARDKANALDDLFHSTADASNVWAKQVHELLDGANVGLVDFQHIIDLYGEAVTAGGRVNDLVKQSDIAAAQRRVTDFISELTRGHKTLAQLIEFVGASQNTVAQTLAKTLAAFKEGKVTAQAIRTLLDLIEERFPNEPIADLAKALERALADGSLR